MKKYISKRKWLLFLAALFLAIVGGILHLRINGTQKVHIVRVSQNNLKVRIYADGNITSGKSKTYYAKAAIPIHSVDVKVGDAVHRGDIMVTYDADKLVLIKRQAELTIKQATESYQGQLQHGNKNSTKQRSAEAMLPEMTVRAEDLKRQAADLNNKIIERQTMIGQTITELQMTLPDINQDGIPDTNQPDVLSNEEYQKLRLQIQQAVTDKQNELTSDAQIQDWQRQINNLNMAIVDLTEVKTDLKVQHQTGEAGSINQNDINALAAQANLSQLIAQDTLNAVNEAAAGVTADFDGIVTGILVTEGEYIQEGSPLLTIESMEDAQVTFYPDEDDLAALSLGQTTQITTNGKAYRGKVSRISRTAENAVEALHNSDADPNIAIEVQIASPDDGIILGARADVEVITNGEKDVLILPSNVLHHQNEETYVYVIRAGRIRKQAVETGLQSDKETQILGGLTFGDMVISDAENTLSEGKRAVIRE